MNTKQYFRNKVFINKSKYEIGAKYKVVSIWNKFNELLSL